MRKAIADSRKEVSLVKKSDSAASVKQGAGFSRSNDSENMIESPNSRLRAKGLELLEEQLINDPNTTPDIAENLIDPFLSDTNNRVRANAVKAMYKYNPQKAIKVLVNMTRL